MNQRFRVVSATVLAVIGVAVLSVPLLGGSELKAAGLQSTGFDFSRVLVWAGVITLSISSLLFVASE